MFSPEHFQLFTRSPATLVKGGRSPSANAEMKMSKTLRLYLAIAAIGLTSIGALSEASAQRAPYRHYSSHGYVGRYYPPGEGNSQYPDYSHTGSGYSRSGCSASPAEC
jgi:hypothetical protein